VKRTGVRTNHRGNTRERNTGWEETPKRRFNRGCVLKERLVGVCEGKICGKGNTRTRRRRGVTRADNKRVRQEGVQRVADSALSLDGQN